MNKVHINLKEKAFTLIELLVVISIIGVLAIILMANYNSVRERARDTQRKSDLSQYRNALGEFGSKNSGLYPQYISGAGTNINTLCTTMSLAVCPNDPLNPPDTSRNYKYQSDGTASNGQPVATRYVLWSEMESSTNFWVLCSNGNVGEVSSGIPPASGNCPI